MTTINIAEAKAHLSELVSKAEAGEEVILMRRGTEVAKIVSLVAPKKAFRSLSAFRATQTQGSPSVAIVRALRDETY
jgi:prevent-host-death family protein